MPEKKKSTVGQQFIKLLDSVAQNKEKLLDLACAVIKHSPSLGTPDTHFFFVASHYTSLPPKKE